MIMPGVEWYPFLNVPTDRPVGMIVRHSERKQIKKGTSGNNIHLTSKGREKAHALAKSFGEETILTTTSPVLRCVQTAEYFKENSLTQSLITSNLLGDPGVFIEDSKIAWRMFLEYGEMGVAKKIVLQENIEGFKDPKNMCLKLITYILETICNKGVYPFITHDYIIASLVGILMDIPVNNNTWPKFLESIFVWKDKDRVFLLYRENLKILEVSNFS